MGQTHHKDATDVLLSFEALESSHVDVTPASSRTTSMNLHIKGLPRSSRSLSDKDKAVADETGVRHVWTEWYLLEHQHLLHADK